MVPPAPESGGHAKRGRTRQHTGNWPGVTVEKTEGTVSFNGYQINMVDLPGTYSLTAYSLEERLVRQFIMQHRPGCPLNQQSVIRPRESGAHQNDK